ncbi:AraC family transcriptional regulator, partial [Frankia sp. CN4]|nr:AraC family transcriptional regulator [Frankia nepalensis]
ARAARAWLLATAASAAGYADQPHLSRDVHALAGTSLGELVAVPAPPA